MLPVVGRRGCNCIWRFEKSPGGWFMMGGFRPGMHGTAWWRAKTLTPLTWPEKDSSSIKTSQLFSLKHLSSFGWKKALDLSFFTDKTFSDGQLVFLPILAPPKASLNKAFPGCGFGRCMRWFIPPWSVSLFLLGCSTGSTRLRFFGSFERAFLSVKNKFKKKINYGGKRRKLCLGSFELCIICNETSLQLSSSSLFASSIFQNLTLPKISLNYYKRRSLN